MQENNTTRELISTRRNGCHVTKIWRTLPAPEPQLNPRLEELNRQLDDLNT